MLRTLLIAALATGVLSVQASAQHDHAHAEIAPPATLSECITQIRELHAKIGRDLGAGIIQPVHTDADALAQYAKLLGRTALKDPTVPRDRVKAMNIAGKDLAKVAEDLHHAADENDGPASKSLYAALAPIMARLDADAGPAAAQKWTCDMHCEGCKTFDAPGTCPVCKMPYTKLQDVPYSVRVSATGVIYPGARVLLTIALMDRAGCPVKDIAVVHEHPLHFMVVANDLSWYAHEHPIRQKDGTFTLDTLAFPAPGKYTVFADFTPVGEPNQIAITSVTIPGDAPASTFKLVEDFDTVAKIDGYEIRVRCNGKKFFVGEDSFLRYGIDKDGKPVTDLQPLMGELGHLVIIGQDLKTYVHSHPMTASTTAASDDKHDHSHAHAGHDHSGLEDKLKAALLENGKPSDITFHAIFPSPGLYRAFAQFQHNGKVLLVPFTIDAQLPEGGAPAAPARKPADHSGHNH